MVNHEQISIIFPLPFRAAKQGIHPAGKPVFQPDMRRTDDLPEGVNPVTDNTRKKEEIPGKPGVSRNES